MNEKHLKRVLFELFDYYDDYYEIIDSLRSFVSNNVLSNEEYDIILKNYENWLKEYNNKESDSNV